MTPAGAARLLDLLAARAGLVCAVGAGGKKSTLYRLAEAHLLAGSARIGLTCTVSMGPPPRSLPAHRLVAPAETLAEEVPALARRHRLLAYAGPSAKPGRLGGVPGELIAGLHAEAGFAVTLVKADGARMRWLKAPRDDEPVLPPDAATVLAVVSIRALGELLEPTIAHRIERVAAVTGAALGARLEPAHLARLLTSPEGALQRGRRGRGGAGRQHGRRRGAPRRGARGRRARARRHPALRSRGADLDDRARPGG